MEELNPRRCRVDRRGVQGRAEYRGWMREQGYSPRSIALYTSTLERAHRYLQGQGTTLVRATAPDLHAFMQTIPPTRSSRAAVRYSLIAYYKMRGKKDGGPANELLLPPSPYRQPRPTTIETYLRLVHAATELGGRHQVVGHLLAFTSCRFGELERASWHQFDLVSDDPVWYVDGKAARRRGRKPRQIPLHDTLVATLVGYRSENGHRDPLFPSDRSQSGRLANCTLRNYWRDICDAAGTGRIQPHVIRHTTATAMLAKTKDLRGLQEWLGHASLASTQLYTGVDATRLRSLLDALPDGAA